MSDYEERLGRQLYRQGRYAEAEAAFRLALAKQPHDASLMLELAQCLDVEERADEALTLFSRAAELSPNVADAHNGVGICEADAQRAEAAFRRAISIDPAVPEFHGNLAVCLLRQSRPADAEPCFRTASGLDPGNLDLIADWGEVLLELNRFRDAESVVRRTLADLPDRRDLLDGRLWGYYESQRFLDAEAGFARLSGSVHSGEPWLHCVLGRALSAQGTIAAAFDHLRIAVGLAPRNADLHEYLARHLEAMRRPDAAGAAYARAREL